MYMQSVSSAITAALVLRVLQRVVSGSMLFHDLRTFRVNPRAYRAIRTYALSYGIEISAVDDVLRHALGLPAAVRKLGPRTYWPGATVPPASISVSEEVLAAIDSIRRSAATPGKRIGGRVTTSDTIVYIMTRETPNSQSSSGEEVLT